MSWSSSSCFCLLRRTLRSLGSEEAAGCSATSVPAVSLRAAGDFRANTFSDLKDMVTIRLINQSNNCLFGGKSHKTVGRILIWTKMMAAICRIPPKEVDTTRSLIR